MVNISLEKKLLGAMIHEPALAQRYLIKKAWFSDDQVQQVADVLIHSNRHFEDIAEISSDVRKKYPYTTINDEWLQAVSFESMYVQNFKASLRTLQRDYLDDRVQEAGLDYAEYQTEKYRKQLEDAIKELNDLEVNDDEELLEEPLNELLEEMENGREPGVQTFGQLDRLLGLGIENANLFVVGGRPGTGKGHPNSLEIPTPEGMKKVGNLEIDDYVFDRFGQPTKVTGVYPRGKLETYKVTLNDGRSTVVDGDHIWSHFSRGGNGKEHLINKTTKEMYEKGTHLAKEKKSGKVGHHAKYSIPTNRAVDFKKKEHSVAPYVIGALIGDGCLLERPLTVSSDDEPVLQRVADETNTVLKKQPYENYSWMFQLKQPLGKKKYLQTKDILADYESLMTYSYLKEIPEEYLFTNISDRMQLLKGLFDTDGHAASRGKRLTVSYSTASKKLAEQIRWLLQSCGFLSGIVLDRREGRRDCYQINVLSDAKHSKELFSLPRKKKIVESHTFKGTRKYDRIAIKSIEKTEELEEITCISVEAEDSLYLANDFIVTHNTAYAINLVLEAMRRQVIVIDFFTLEMTNLQMLKRFMSNLSMINSYKLRDTSLLPDEDKQKLIFHSDWLYKQDIQIHSKKNKLSDIKSTIIQRSQEAGDKKYMAVIDYLQLMDAENPYAKRNEQVGQVSRELKQLTNKQNIPIIALSQLNRDIENRQDKTPSLADLRESGDIEQDANNIGFLYLDDENDSDSQQVQIRFNIAKQRDGKTGTIDYYFDKGLMTFKEVE